MKTFIKSLFAVGAIVLLSSQTLLSQEGRIGYKIKYDPFEHISSELFIQGRRSNFNNIENNAWLIEGEFNYKKNKYFKPGISFRYKRTNESKMEERLATHQKIRIATDLKIKIPENIKNFTLENKIRYQYSKRISGQSKTYFRNQITAKAKPSDNFTGYLSQESFYNLNKKKLDRLRVQFGINLKLNNKIGVGGYYIIESRISDELKNYYITGIELTMKL